jgi:hypothetical protein
LQTAKSFPADFVPLAATRMDTMRALIAMSARRWAASGEHGFTAS